MRISHLAPLFFQPVHLRYSLWPVLLFSTLILSSCTPEQEPEIIAGNFIEQLEKSIEDRDIRSFRSLISEDYSDGQGQFKQDLVSTAAGYIIRNKSIHIYSRLESAERNKSLIEATILSAVTGRTIDDLTLLPDMNADMYWVELVLDTGSGKPRLTRAAWRQAMLDDFLGD